MSDTWYSTREIARAAGVSESRVRAALAIQSRASRYVSREEAVRVGRALRAECAEQAAQHPTRSDALFSVFEHDPARTRTRGLPLAVTSTVHVGLFIVVVFIGTLGLAPSAATTAYRSDLTRLVFVALPGPGGGGGGGGLRQPAPPPKAEREGRRAMSNPLPARPPEPVQVEPPPVRALQAESLPVIAAPLITLPADARDRIGALADEPGVDSAGPGVGGGTGVGAGQGVGEGTGAGVGPGSGGGTGGGPYRPGSGIEPPRLLREVRPVYTEEARRRRLVGDVILEIVVRQDGSVGDLKIVRGLGGGLNERAVEAVRQWRFSPARRHGAPVDVLVEVAVEFRLR
jgi:TonB family protein